jgi:hypothetical protein
MILALTSHDALSELISEIFEKSLPLPTLKDILKFFKVVN